MKDNRTSVGGFTLIELLVTIAITGILTSIAIPEYKAYRIRAFDSVALSDVRNIVLAEETYFLDNQTYQSCQNQGCADMPGMARLSKGVSLGVAATDTSYVITARHHQGSRQFVWDSESGGLKE